jgi:hypothetical protein
MTLNFSIQQKCLSCPFGKCTTYIREQSKKMKDRDTLYRISQNKLMACIFDEGLPGAPGYAELLDDSIDSVLTRMLGVALESGLLIERLEPEHYGETESGFIITKAQAGKIRGDIAEALMRAIFWNMCVEINANTRLKSEACKQAPSDSRETPLVSIITVGDNYDLKQLFDKDSAKAIEGFEKRLAASKTGLYYSTPDFFIVNISSLDEQSRTKLQVPIADLGLDSQQRLSEARYLVERKLTPDDILMVFGLKTSIRSDRMYQFLYEANGFKAVWRGAFNSVPPRYLSVMTRTFGANYNKLSSAEFLSLLEEFPSKAIDHVVHGESIREIRDSLSSELIKIL